MKAHPCSLCEHVFLVGVLSTAFRWPRGSGREPSNSRIFCGVTLLVAVSSAKESTRGQRPGYVEWGHIWAEPFTGFPFLLFSLPGAPEGICHHLQVADQFAVALSGPLG